MSNKLDESYDVHRDELQQWYLDFITILECSNGCKLCEDGQRQAKHSVKCMANYLETDVSFLDDSGGKE